MNKSLDQYLPKVAQVISDQTATANKLRNKITLDESIEETADKRHETNIEELRNIKFDVHTLKSEVMIIKGIAKPEMMAMVRKCTEKIKYIQGQISLMTTDLASTAKHNDF